MASKKFKVTTPIIIVGVGVTALGIAYWKKWPPLIKFLKGGGMMTPPYGVPPPGMPTPLPMMPTPLPQIPCPDGSISVNGICPQSQLPPLPPSPYGSGSQSGCIDGSQPSIATGGLCANGWYPGAMVGPPGGAAAAMMPAAAAAVPGQCPGNVYPNPATGLCADGRPPAGAAPIPTPITQPTTTPYYGNTPLPYAPGTSAPYPYPTLQAPTLPTLQNYGSIFPQGFGFPTGSYNYSTGSPLVRSYAVDVAVPNLGNPNAPTAAGQQLQEQALIPHDTTVLDVSGVDASSSGGQVSGFGLPSSVASGGQGFDQPMVPFDRDRGGIVRGGGICPDGVSAPDEEGRCGGDRRFDSYINRRQPDFDQFREGSERPFFGFGQQQPFFGFGFQQPAPTPYYTNGQCRECWDRYLGHCSTCGGCPQCEQDCLVCNILSGGAYSGPVGGQFGGGFGGGFEGGFGDRDRFDGRFAPPIFQNPIDFDRDRNFGFDRDRGFPNPFSDNRFMNFNRGREDESRSREEGRSPFGQGFPFTRGFPFTQQERRGRSRLATAYAAGDPMVMGMGHMLPSPAEGGTQSGGSGAGMGGGEMQMPNPGGFHPGDPGGMEGGMGFHPGRDDDPGNRGIHPGDGFDEGFRNRGFGGGFERNDRDIFRGHPERFRFDNDRIFDMNRNIFLPFGYYQFIQNPCQYAQFFPELAFEMGCFGRPGFGPQFGVPSGFGPIQQQAFGFPGFPGFGERFENRGFPFNGFDARGFDRDGRDRFGFDRFGFDKDGFDRQKRHRSGRQHHPGLTFPQGFGGRHGRGNQHSFLDRDSRGRERGRGGPGGPGQLGHSGEFGHPEPRDMHGGFAFGGAATTSLDNDPYGYGPGFGSRSLLSIAVS